MKSATQKSYLDELPYYSNYQLAEIEVPLARYLLPSDPSEVQRGIESGRFPTLANLARQQRQLGQPPSPLGDAANESPPAPFPPRRTKAELLGSTDFSKADEFTRSVTPEPSDDWERLAQRLFQKSRSNLDKVRAAFCFACTHWELPEVEKVEQPYECVRLGNYNQVFAALLIIADVPMQSHAEVAAEAEASAAARAVAEKLAAESAKLVAKSVAIKNALTEADAAAKAAAEANDALKAALIAASSVKAFAKSVPKSVAESRAAEAAAVEAASDTRTAAEAREISKTADGVKLAEKTASKADSAARAAAKAAAQVQAIATAAVRSEAKAKSAADAAAKAAAIAASQAEVAASVEAAAAAASASSSSQEAEASARAATEITANVTAEADVASKGAAMAASASVAAAKSVADAKAAAAAAAEAVAAAKAEIKLLFAQLDAALLERNSARMRKAIASLEPHEGELLGKKFNKLREAQLTLTALQNRKDLRDAMAAAQRSRNTQDLRALVHRLEEEAEPAEAQLSLFREDLRLAREAIQRDDRLKRMPQHRLEMNPKSLSELRQYSRPVDTVHKTVQALLLLLGNYEKRTRKWPRCQPLLKNISKSVADFQPRFVDPRIAARSREILDGIDKREIALQSAAAFTFYEWAMKTTESIKEVASADGFVPASVAQQRRILCVTLEEDADWDFVDEGIRKSSGRRPSTAVNPIRKTTVAGSTAYFEQ